MRWLTCSLFVLVSCAPTVDAAFKPSDKQLDHWQSFGIVIRDGRLTRVYTLSKDGILRVSCSRGASNLIFRETEVGVSDFRALEAKIHELESDLTSNKQGVGAVVVSLVKEKPGDNLRSKSFRSVNADSRLQVIVEKFRSIIPDCD